MNNPEETSRPWWHFGPVFWFGLSVLLVINIAILSGLFKPNIRQLVWGINGLDPRVWPAWIAYLLWGTTLWLVVGLFRWSESAIALKQIVRPILILLLIGLICYFNGWHAPRMRWMIYTKYYVPIIVAPWSNYIIDGRMDWKMLIVPTSGLIALTFLVRLLFQLKKIKRRDKIDSDRT